MTGGRTGKLQEYTCVWGWGMIESDEGQQQVAVEAVRIVRVWGGALEWQAARAAALMSGGSDGRRWQ